MKKLLAALLIAGAAFCYGFVGGPQYDVSYIDVRVGNGGTVWEIADYYYMESKAPMCFEAFVYELKHSKENEKYFTNGRILQPGDVLKVPMYRKVEK